MRPRPPLLAVLCLALLASPGIAETRLVPKLEEGAEYQTRETIKSRQTLKIAGQTQETANATTLVSKTVNGRRNEQGELPLHVTYTEIVAEIQLPGDKKVVYNSATGEATSDDPNFQIIVDRLQAMKGMSYTVTFDRENNIKSITGLRPDTDVSAEDLKTATEQTLRRYPSEAVQPGDKWEREVVLPLGAGQMFKLKRRYQYVGPEVRSTVTGTQRLEKVTGTTESVEYAIRPGGGLPGMVTKSDLKVESSENRLLFDPQQGRTVESLDKMHVTGAFTLSIMNMDLSGDLDLMLEIKSEDIK